MADKFTHFGVEGCVLIASGFPVVEAEDVIDGHSSEMSSNNVACVGGEHLKFVDVGVWESCSKTVGRAKELVGGVLLVGPEVGWVPTSERRPRLGDDGCGSFVRWSATVSNEDNQRRIWGIESQRKIVHCVAVEDDPSLDNRFKLPGRQLMHAAR